jgi:putative ABC transport system permease protein
MLRALFSRVAATFRRRRLEQEFDEEVLEHLNLLEERFIRQGMQPREAFYAARRRFGGVAQMKEELRERRTLPPLDVLFQDLRHAFRQLRKARGFTASAALTLALGIGASTAIFAVLDAVVLQPLAFVHPDQLMSVASFDRRGGGHPTNLSYPNFLDFRSRNHAFEHLVCYRDSRFTLTDTLPAIQVEGQIVSWNLFPLLGVQPELGRGFLPEEEKPGTHVVVLSHALWQSRFGGDHQIPGKHIHINGEIYTVTGVTPRGFHFPVDDRAAQLWTTIAEDDTVSEFTPLMKQRGARVTDGIGRLAAGVTPEQAKAQLDQIAGALAEQYPDDNGNVAKTIVRPEMVRLVGKSRKPLWILLGAVMLVLLIGCANVANLLLARSTERAREFALRTALGASRATLVCQLLAESLILGLLGTVGGIGLAEAALRLILPLAGEQIPVPRIFESGIDLRVLAFSIAAALVTAILFSLAPAARVMRADLIGALKQGAANIAHGHHGLRSMLVVGQITMGLVLLVGAELLVLSFLKLVGRDPGFRADHLLTFDIGLSDKRYTTATTIAFSDRLMEKLRAIPGVRAASSGMPLPVAGHQMGVAFDIEQRPLPPAERASSDMSIVTPGFFDAMGIALRKGRDFTQLDNLKAPRVVIVNDAFARKFFAGEDAIGKRIKPGATNGKEGTVMREIVGIVGNARQAPWSAGNDPIYYLPYKQVSWWFGTVVLRTAVPPLEVESAARIALMSLDREAAMYQVRTGDERSAMAYSMQRFLMVLMASFAAIALVLTVVGIYGLLAYAVARRRREIGLRVALGAGRREVLGMVLRQAGRLVVVGLVLGLAGAAGVQRLLESIIFEVRADDPVFLLSAGAVIVIAGFAAAYIPALRAASVDPMQALRSE